MTTKNVMGRERKTYKGEKPYIVLEQSDLPGWRWEVLKTYQADPAKPYARAFVFVTSPMTGPGGDLGDSYISDIGRTIVDFDRDVFANGVIAGEALFGWKYAWRLAGEVLH